MNINDKIKGLIDAYFEGKTSLIEEEELRNYFTSVNVADELKQYQAIFGYFADKRNNPQMLEDINDNIIPDIPVQSSSKRRNIVWYTITGIAAGIALLLTVSLFNKQQEITTGDAFCEGTYVIINGICTDDPAKVSEVGINAIDAILQPISEVEAEIDNLINDNTNIMNEHIYFLEQLEIKN